jgi:hypothetical protein
LLNSHDWDLTQKALVKIPEESALEEAEERRFMPPLNKVLRILGCYAA